MGGLLTFDMWYVDEGAFRRLILFDWGKFVEICSLKKCQNLRSKFDGWRMEWTANQRGSNKSRWKNDLYKFLLDQLNRTRGYRPNSEESTFLLKIEDRYSIGSRPARLMALEVICKHPLISIRKLFNEANAKIAWKSVMCSHHSVPRLRRRHPTRYMCLEESLIPTSVGWPPPSLRQRWPNQRKYVFHNLNRSIHLSCFATITVYRPVPFHLVQPGYYSLQST